MGVNLWKDYLSVGGEGLRSPGAGRGSPLAGRGRGPTPTSPRVLLPGKECGPGYSALRAAGPGQAVYKTLNCLDNTIKARVLNSLIGLYYTPSGGPKRDFRNVQ